MAVYKQFILIFLLFSNYCFAAEDLYSFNDRAAEKRYQQLLLEIRCMKCENQSIVESNAPLAEDLRKNIYHQMIAGKSDEDIKAYLVERYGDTILYEPPMQANTWILWFAPLIFVLIGAVVWLWRKNK